ncbi:MAG: hypothetical protein AAF702_00820 [Chloroflexota bacterium]
MYKNQQRADRYYHLNSELAQIDNAHLTTLLDSSKPLTAWGNNEAIEISGTKVFVKRIPITDVEQQNMFSTANLYDLPPYYNYGAGSVGSNVCRELVTHIKTTNWVLSGQADFFPLLYHYRILPFNGEHAEIKMADHDEYVTYWGSSDNIGRYMLDRANATAELLLFLEYIPKVLSAHLDEHPEELDERLIEVRSIVDFLQTKGMLHFDLHFWNVLTDGESLYLTDFGLLLDKNFPLQENELAFFQATTNYDYARMLADVVVNIFVQYQRSDDEIQQQLRSKLGVSEEDNRFDKMIVPLFENLDEIAANGPLDVPNTFLACIDRYRGIITMTIDFMSTIGGGPQKDIPFPNEEIGQLLRDTGFVSNGAKFNKM